MISVPQDTLSPTESCKIEVTILVGGQFQLPEQTELVSCVYRISLSKPLLKPVKLEIQHCLRLVTQDNANCLSFATAPNQKSSLPYQFKLIEGGQFDLNKQYGSIYVQEFSFWTIFRKYFWPSPLYIGKVFYEKKTAHEWLMRFVVTRDLNALNKVSFCFYRNPFYFVIYNSM